MGAEPVEHDHGFNGQVIVAVQEVTLDNIVIYMAFLEHLQRGRQEFKVAVNKCSCCVGQSKQPTNHC